jgi:organic hydroperoxide reductase OsmC/OhrA
MSESEAKTKQFIYKNSLKWQGQKRGLLSSIGKPDVAIATPPEFKGHPGIWTPEDLFVASVNSCVMTTFLYYAEKQGLGLVSYESEAEGVLEKVKDKFMFSKITVKPKILIVSDSQLEKAKNVAEFTEKNCLISNSVESKVILEAEMKVK